ncbi:MAG: FtsK/SpoIIIE domain-containing protein [Oscillospiraceae bacterium]|nr:FtsK/SpoIIIE domain-containing protein [Oscillospiraceae bacterium]
MSLNKMLCALGKFDIPIIQMQPPFVVDLLDSNIALVGSAMSGKTTFVKTLVNLLHKQYNETQEQVFILDFGGALTEYKDYPLVSAYFDNSNEEYVKRVFKILDNVLKENIKELNGKNFRDADTQPLHTTFIIDNLNAFIDEPRYTAYHEKLAKLCRDGLSKGITVVITAADTKGIVSYLGGFKQKIAFELPPDKYGEVFTTGKVGLIGNNPGHGFANVTVKPDGVTGTFRMNLPYEVQCTLPYKPENAEGSADTEDTFKAKVQKKYDSRSVKKYQTFPKELTREEYETLCRQSPPKDIPDGAVSVGLDYVDFNPVTVDFEKSNVIAIYGKKEFGKTNLLNLLLDGFISKKRDARVILFDDGRNQLKPIYDSISGKTDTILINKHAEIPLSYKDGSSATKKLSPIQQFYKYLNENHLTLSKSFLAETYGLKGALARDLDSKIPDYSGEATPFTVFVIQSKSVYINDLEKKQFIEKILSQMLDDAEERGYLFIFSDIQKINEAETNSAFKNAVNIAFLLDNIAEFAGERGQKTLFGDMDVKSLKEDYARCERGDGYFYDAEADNLHKLKFIKY